MTGVSPDQLEAIPFFGGLPEDQLASLAKASSEKFLKKDSLVFLKGARPTGLFAVLSGTIKAACQSPKGEEKVIDLLGPGRVFGEAALLLDCPQPYMAGAATRVRLLHVDGRALLNLVGRSPELSLRMLLHLSQGIVSVTHDIEGFRMLTAPKRVARFLLDRHGEAQRASQPITLPVSKHVFASRLWMAPESLSRSMRDLAAAGVIEARKRSIRVIDGTRLAALAG